MHFKYQLQHGIKSLNYLMVHILSNYLMVYILYKIFKIILSIFKKSGEETDNPLIRIYVNKIENIITFEIKTGCYLKLQTPETMKLLGSTKSKITKDENGENVSTLEITEVI